MRGAGLGTIAGTIAFAACTVTGTIDSQGIDDEASGGSVSKGGTSSTKGGASNSTGGTSQNGGTGNGNSGATSGGSSNNGSGGNTSTGGASTGGTGGIANPPVGEALSEKIRTATVEVAAGVKAGVRNWRIWKSESLVVSPVFTVPLANCETLVGFTTGSNAEPTTRIVRLDAQDKLVKEMVVEAGVECRGVAAEPDGHFAALLWDDESDSIRVRRYDRDGAALSTTELTNGDNKPTDFGIGESRLEFGDGKYGAYYHVHSDSGHEGDTYKFVSTSGQETTQWGWGCSHSMSNLLRYNDAHKAFLSVCVTDCYPGTNGDFSSKSIGGVYIDNRRKVIDVDAGCNGSVAGELGGAAIAPSGWKLVFNTHQAPASLGQSSYDPDSMNQDIAFSSVAENRTPGNVLWLTNTPEINEADSSIVRFQPAGGNDEQYVVGWSEPGSTMRYKLARIDAGGAFLEQPVDVTSKVQWGRRDDPFREHQDRDIIWAWFDKAGSSTLRIARIEASVDAECAAF